MRQQIARDIMNKETRANTLKELAESAGDKLDEEIEKAYKMAADALSYKLIPVEGYEYNGEQLYIKVFI